MSLCLTRGVFFFFFGWPGKDLLRRRRKKLGRKVENEEKGEKFDWFYWEKYHLRIKEC